MGVTYFERNIWAKNGVARAKDLAKTGALINLVLQSSRRQRPSWIINSTSDSRARLNHSKRESEKSEIHNCLRHYRCLTFSPTANHGLIPIVKKTWLLTAKADVKKNNKHELLPASSALFERANRRPQLPPAPQIAVCAPPVLALRKTRLVQASSN